MERITDKYVFFYKSRISNWHMCQFKYKGITFFNTEQAFMWEKAIFFGDMETAKKIVETPNPAENKKLGRMVKNFNTEKWDDACFDFMVAVNYAKFSQNKYSKELLLSTNDKILVEASKFDKIWGIGLHWSDDDVLDETKWQGKNLLGKALMVVREQLKQEN